MTLRPLPSLLLGLVALLLFAPFGEASRNRIHGPGTQPGGGIDIEGYALFNNLPRRGFAPIRITISNGSGREETWTFAFSSSKQFGQGITLNHETSLTVPAGEAKRFDLLVPVARHPNYGHLTGLVSGPGIIPSERGLQVSSGHYSYLPSSAIVAMSPTLWTANWSKLEEAASAGRSGNVHGAEFDTAMMPTDWRAFAGYDVICMTDLEWMKTGAAERLAVLDWVAAGGRLYVCREPGDTSAMPGLSGFTEDTPLARGFGTIRSWPRTGADLDIEATKTEFYSRANSVHHDLGASYRRETWALLEKLPEVRLRTGLFIGFLFLFAIVIGPANLFLFARGSRRYRLFWTTPAISFGASLAIFLLILFQDGVGGTGHQISVWNYLPGENKAIVLQEQASRTSLLTSRRFVVENPISLSQIETQSATSLSSPRMAAGHRSFSGDWFRNRATQAHLLEGVVATRWRIEPIAALTPGSAPELLSTFPFTLDSVYYQDTAGGWWHANGFQPGTALRLEPVEEQAFLREWRAFTSETGAIIKRRLNSPTGETDRRGHFFAFSEGAPEAVWQTLESVDWKTRKSLHTGPLAAPNP